jgi:NAD(P)H-flavin reductase
VTIAVSELDVSKGFEGRVLACRPAAEGLVAVSIDVRGTPLVGAHLFPGQYVRVSAAGQEHSFFAIASPPGPDGGTLELLVKRAPGTADAIACAPIGSSVRLSPPLGRGFPLERARGKHIVLVATGSGISPIRSLIGSIRRDRASYGEVTLYFGARTPSAFAYQEELAAWERDGIRVVRTVSRPHGGTWTGLTGYVQAHLPEARLEDTVAFLCGQDAMIRGVADVLTSRGMPGDAVFTNV